MAINDITVESGYIIVTNETGRKERFPLDTVLEKVKDDGDMPDMPIASLTLLTKLAQVVTILVKQLIEQGILEEKLVDGWDMQYIYDTTVDDLSAEW